VSSQPLGGGAREDMCLTSDPVSWEADIPESGWAGEQGRGSRVQKLRLAEHQAHADGLEPDSQEAKSPVGKVS
jgi:hypothetical protein